jgi:hypothetical protein
MIENPCGSLDAAASAVAQGECKSSIKQHPSTSSSALERWTVKSLCQLVPGSTRRNWNSWIPGLVAAGVLTKRGKGWLGRRAEIEAALVVKGTESARSVRP